MIKAVEQQTVLTQTCLSKTAVILQISYSTQPVECFIMIQI